MCNSLQSCIWWRRIRNEKKLSASAVALPAVLSSSFASTLTVNALLPARIKHDSSNVLLEQGLVTWKTEAETENLLDNPCFQAEWDTLITFIRNAWKLYTVRVFWTLTSHSLFAFLNFKAFWRSIHITSHQEVEFSYHSIY